MRALLGFDRQVYDWGLKASGWRPMAYNMVVGVLDGEDNLVGGFAYTDFNGSNVEVCYFGPRSLTRDVMREIATIALLIFKVNRVTIHTVERGLKRGFEKLGAVCEGICHRYYGPSDEPQDSPTQYALFRPALMRIAGLEHDHGEV